MGDPSVHRARIVASAAATAISLACGTNYVYSAWAPQFADRLKLSSTESNLIGLFGNMGMYLVGFPVGVLIDSRGPRPAVIAGMTLLALGYFPLHQAYDMAAGPVPLLCLFSFLTGLGSCMAFTAAMKTSALNWPDHRGTATAFPLAAFGLSAFFFSTLGAIFFNGDTSPFLLLLACGTAGTVFISLFFLRVIPPHNYSVILPVDPILDSGVNQASDRVTDDIAVIEPTTPPRGHSASPILNSSDPTNHRSLRSDEELPEQLPRGPGEGPSDTLPPGVFTDHETSDETSSLISHASSLPGEILVQSSVDIRRSHRVDLRGVQLLPLRRFWQLFVLMGVLSGIGLMTINNVGNVVKALWRKYDDSADQTFIVRTQQLHVSILSLCSFSGRLLSGVGSDFLVKVLDANRLWCIAIASTIFFLAQLCAILITNPHLLAFVSGLSGLGYGFLFGVFPSIVAETFGIHGLSQNWGFMTLAPAITGNAFNIFYGKIYDTHSTVGPGGQRICLEGVECYKSAYVTSLVASVVGLGLALWIIQSDRKETLLGGKDEQDDH